MSVVYGIAVSRSQSTARINNQEKSPPPWRNYEVSTGGIQTGSIYLLAKLSLAEVISILSEVWRRLEVKFRRYAYNGGQTDTPTQKKTDAVPD